MLEVMPVVRHMLLCDDVQVRPKQPHKLNILGLAGTINALGLAADVRHLVTLGVFLQVTELYRDTRVSISVSDADWDDEIYLGKDHLVVAAPTPLHVVPLHIRIGPVDFPHDGLYWVNCRFDGHTHAQEPLMVR